MNRLISGFLVMTVAATVVAADEREVFDRLDTDDDGQLTVEEVGEQHTRLFWRLVRLGDENADGRLSEAEFVAETTKDVEDSPRPERKFSAANRPPFSFQQFFARLDRNGDHRLSRDEAPQRMRQNFDRLDRNSDGFIDGTELQRIAAAIRQRANANLKPSRD